MKLRTCAHIHLSALQHNLRQVKKLTPHSRIMAMVKANAYGHGLLRVAHALIEADAFGVATLEEAMVLRQSGIHKPIVLMCGFMDSDGLRIMSEHYLSAVIHHVDQIALLQNTVLASPLTVWLKIDTGMHRLGFFPHEVAAAYKQLADNVNVVKPIGFMTHLASSDDPGNAHTLQQIALFNETVVWEGPRSLACSAGAVAWPQTHADWVRPGIMLYGVSPFAQQCGSEFGLKPAMSLTARLMAIKALKKGDSVGYGASWICAQDTTIGLVSIGYGDGYPRHAKYGTPVLINGKRYPLAGRVSMDIISVDLGDKPDAAVGDTVILWGEGLPVEEIAQCAGTIGYELLSKITSRVPFIS